MNTLQHSSTVAEAFAHGVSIHNPSSDIAMRFACIDVTPYGNIKFWQLTESEWSTMTDAVDNVLSFLTDTLGMGQLSDTTGVLAWAYDAEMWCADHGAVFPEDNGMNEGASPVFKSWELDAVEYCGHGHSFCGACGQDMDMMRGSQDTDVSGHFARCWNCGQESVYVDGAGYVDVYRWADATDRVKVEAYVNRPTAPVPPSFQNYTTIDEVLNEAGTNVRTLCAYVGWVDVDPAAGTVLVLVNGESYDDYGVSTADEAALDHFADKLAVDPYDDEDAADFRASVNLLRVPTDQVWFTTKP